MLITITLTVTVTAVAVALISAQLLRSSAETQLRREMRRQAAALAELYALQAERSASENRSAPRFAPERLERLAGGSIYYLGSPLFPDDDSALATPVNLTLPDQLQIIRAVEWEPKPGLRLFGYAAPVKLSGHSVGALVVARPRSAITEQWRPLATQVSLVLLAGLLLASIVAIALARRITSPLRKLARAAGDIARGRYRVPELEEITSADEIGQLAAAFRDMTLKLREVDARDRRFLMSVSHELRTPLTAIEGHAQAMQEGLADDPESRERSLAVIYREAHRLERLVDDIIDLARLRSNRFNTVTELVQLERLGEHLLEIFEELVHEDLEVSGTFDEAEFYSDGQRILQIVRNLVNNALRHAETYVRVRGTRHGGTVELTVSNDGKVIPDEMIERIFDPFVGDKREGGMGLGLTISRELAWALGGNLQAVPDAKGATFKLTLPIEPPMAR